MLVGCSWFRCSHHSPAQVSLIRVTKTRQQIHRVIKYNDDEVWSSLLDILLCPPIQLITKSVEADSLGEIQCILFLVVVFMFWHVWLFLGAGHGCVYRGYLPVLLPHVCGCFHRDVGSRWRRPALNKKPGENKHAAEGCLSLSNTALTCFFLLHRPLLSWQLRQLKCRWSKANGEQMQQQGAITSHRWRVSPLNQLFNHSITNIKVFPQNIYSNVM